MNIPTYLLGAIIFVVAQTSAGIWWASGLSSEVDRLAGIQNKAIPALEAEAVQCGKAIHDQGQQIERIKELTAETSGLDVLGFRIDSMTKEIENIKEAQRDIIAQHEKIFTMLSSGPMQQKGNPYN